MPGLRWRADEAAGRGARPRRRRYCPLSVEAMMCWRCGERLYSEDTVRRFERILGQTSRPLPRQRRRP